MNTNQQITHKITDKQKTTRQKTTEKIFPSSITPKDDEGIYYILSEWSENLGRISDIEIINTTAYFLSTKFFFVADISNITNPQILSKYSEVGAPIDCYVDNQTAFITDRSRGLLLINVSDPFNIRRIGQYLKDQYEQVLVRGEIAYLRSYDHIDFLNISDPSWITRIKRYDIYCDDFALSDDQLIIARNPEDIIGLNVSNLDNLAKLFEYHTETWIQNFELENNLLYFSYFNWSEGFTKFTVLNVSNPFNLSVVGKQNFSGSIDNFIVGGNYCFLTSINDLLIYNITNPGNIEKVSQLAFNNLYLEKLFHSMNYLFIIDNSYLFQVYDIQNISNPKRIHRESTGEVQGVTISNGIAYLSKGLSGLVILNVTDVENPTKIHQLTLDKAIKKVIIIDQLAFLGCGKDGLLIYNIQNLMNPIKLGEFDKGQIDDFVITNNCAIIGDSEKGLLIVNVSEPTSPTQISQLNSSLLWDKSKTSQQPIINPLSIYLHEDFICLTYGVDFYLISMYDPTSPILLYDETIGEVTDVAFVDQLMYMLVSAHMLIFDINNSSDPQRMLDYSDYYFYDKIAADNQKLFLYGYRELLVLNNSNPNNLTQIDYLFLSGIAAITTCQIINQSLFLSDSSTDLMIISGDFDKDNLYDYFEVKDFGTDPNKADTDDDNLNDFEEIWEIGTNPRVADTDGDGFTDGEEVLWGSDPLDDASLPTIPPSTTQPSTENSSIAPWLIWFIGISSGISILLIISVGFIIVQRRINKIQMKKVQQEQQQEKQAKLLLYRYLISLKNNQKQTLDQICQHSNLAREEIIKMLELWRDSGDLEKIGFYDEQEEYFVRKINQHYSEKQANCYYCQETFNSEETRCPHCGFEVLRCPACNLPIQPNELIGLCPYCETFFHFSHLLDYLEMNDHCPHCSHLLQSHEIKLLTKPVLSSSDENS
ncbi:MAG: hypothetical protein GF308_19805 [Candidatus Heimdallarchaeota archaeon]|nr:hypothetical protein [Candidatus Heimdallarchaeota archaeon]